MPRFEHPAEPLTDTLRRVKDRKPRDGSDPADYPLTAECATCHLEIWIESYDSPRFDHVTREVADRLGLYRTT